MEFAPLAEAWARTLAPSTGDIRAELVRDAAEFLGIPVHEAWSRLSDAGERFREQWTSSGVNPRSAEELTAFYNQSDAELFELIEWHASDPIHFRTIILRDFALGQPGRAFLDYGSGIGSDALVFGEAGFRVTLADISDCLLNFAAYRCRKRGVAVETIDLKTDELPADMFDMVLCLDVLEHIPDPLAVVRHLRASMTKGGVLVIHAPFGEDAVHPMHVVHRDVVTPRLRSMQLRPVHCPFPTAVRAPRLYRKESIPLIDRLAYYLYDGYLDNPLGARLAGCYRVVRRAAAGA